MKKRTKLAKSDDVHIICRSPFPDAVIDERDKEYPNLSDIEFRKKYRGYLFAPAVIEFPNDKNEIQMNFCNNPFCAWYGLSQKTYEDIKYKPSRYKMEKSRGDFGDSGIFRNEIPTISTFKPVLGHRTQTISNWSIAEEVKRLISINGVIIDKPKYNFHKDGCAYSDKTPFENKEYFRKRGKSESNSTKYQCCECGKCTNVLPGQEESFNYHQQRNDILIKLCKLLFARTPVKRICEIHDIGSFTFYSKLDWLYKKCLEFNLRYETQVLSKMSFDKLWINTDMMVYNLNNVRQKGKGGKKPLNLVENKLHTYIIGSTDLQSNYAFRCDLAYDSNVNLEQVEEDTVKYHCDHSYHFLGKNDRLRHSFCPQTPTLHDTQSQNDFLSDLAIFNNRKNYVEGCHVKPQYTAMAHYILL